MPIGIYERKHWWDAGRGHIKDLAGQTFGKLLALWPLRQIRYEPSKGRYRSRVYWVCQCECSAVVLVQKSTLTRGRQKSCGCSRVKEGSALRTLYAQARYKARSRGIDWDLSFADYLKIVFEPCYYTGRGPSNTFKPQHKRDKPLEYNGVDRKDSSKGYNADNCVPCCGIVNKSKLTMSVPEFIQMCKEVTQLHGGLQ